MAEPSMANSPLHVQVPLQTHWHQPREPGVAADLTSPTTSPPATSVTNIPPARGRTNWLVRSWRTVTETLGWAGPDWRVRRQRQVVVKFCIAVVITSLQGVVVIVSTILAAVRASPSPDHPGQSEFSACSILGVWNLIWLGRVVLRCVIVVGMFQAKKRSRAWRAAQAARHRARLVSLRATESGAGHQPWAEQAIPETIRVRHWYTPGLRIRLLVGLCRLLDPYVALIWFFSAVLIIYAHGVNCRMAASDVSAATYTILIILYAQFIVTTFIPMIRTAMARRRASRPVVEKLSRVNVDRIPLVLYIPPPPEGLGKKPTSPTSPISPIPRSFSHSPLSSQSALLRTSKRRRFIFFRPSLKRRHASAESADFESGTHTTGAADGGGGDDEWERIWEPAPFPFVRLPENRATCMICLCEFEAPRKLSDGAPDRNGEEVHEMAAMSHAARDGDQEEGGIEEVRVEAPRPTDAHAVQLADAGSNDAPEPLRLLSCGHVYHKDCVDPWLTQKSGRCPYCQARVELPPPPSSKRSWVRRST